MALDERTTVTRALFAVGLGVSVLGGVLFFGIKALFVANAAANSGDTPVILVGGTMTFKSGAQGTPPPWQTVSGSSPAEYFLDPGYSVAKIVVKKNAPPDDDSSQTGDAQPKSDRLSIDVSDAGTWKIDAYTLAADGITSVKVASLAPKDNTTEIHLKVLDDTDPNAALCFVPSSTVRIRLGHTGSCPDTSSFDSVIVTIDKVVTGTLKCTDGSGTKGTCRIVLRGPPPPSSR